VKIEEEQAAAAAQVEQLRAREQELSSESIFATIDADTTEWATATRASIIEHVRGARNLDEVRAHLLTLFDRFVLHRSDLTRRIAQGGEQPLDFLRAGGDHYIELFVRPETITGWAGQGDGFDEWIGPVTRQVALSSVSNNYSSSSPSQ
jgi:hypothetical protein